jgi:hypothetical protein
MPKFKTKVRALMRLPGPGQQTTVLQALKNNYPDLEFRQDGSDEIVLTYHDTDFEIDNIDRPMKELCKEVNYWVEENVNLNY